MHTRILINSIIIVTLDYLIHKIERTRTMLYSLTRLYAVNYAVYVSFSVAFSFLAAGCVHYISPESPGSGVPEMKSILAGNMMERYISAKTIVGKYLGILSGIGAGFPAARYGPSVHISACIANTLLKLPIFNKLNRNELDKNSMLQAACAAGVAGALGSPFGGVIFLIEVTSNYFKVENLWRAIFCSLIGSLFFYTWRLTGWLGNTEPTLYSTKFSPLPYHSREYVMFVLIGVVCGLVGALFVFVFHKLVRLRQQYTMTFTTRYFLVASVSCICAILAFSMNPLLYASPGSVMIRLFGVEPLADSRLFLRLCVMILGKFISTAIIAVLPVTSGVFGPSMITGAAIGRLIGEVAQLFWPDVVPGGYAVVGATALAAGVTRTVSPIVVMFEITGQLSFMIPMMISSIIAYGIGDLFNLSFYDTVVYLRGLPYLGSIRHPKSYKLKAKDVMREKIDYVTIKMTPDELRNTLSKSKHGILPVVEDYETMNFVGSASRTELLEYAEYMSENFGSSATESSTPNTSSTSGKKEKPFPVDESAFSISATTAAAKIHFLISMVGLSHAWVLQRRSLVGVVVKKDLIKMQL
jgi:chloride channel 2